MLPPFSEGLIIFNSFTLSAHNKKDPVKIYEQFEDRLNISKPNFHTARLDLHFHYQQTDESLDEFYTRCKKKQRTVPLLMMKKTNGS